MKHGSICTALFAIACIAVTVSSAQLMGLGMWGMIFLAAGTFVAVSPYFSPIREMARGIALMSAILALLAVVLGLLAASTGGSFRLPDDQALLLVTIGLIGILGIIVWKRL